MSSYPPPPPGPQDPSGTPGPYGAPGQYGPPGQYPGQYGAGHQHPGQPYPGQYGAQPYPDQYPGQPYPGAPQPQFGGQPPYGADPAGDPLLSGSLGEWFSKVAGVVTRSWKPLVLIQLVAGLVSALVASVVLLVGGFGGAALGSSSGALGGVFLALLLVVVVLVVIGALAQGASLYVAVRGAEGRPAGIGEAFSWAAARALPLIGWSLLAGLLVVVGAALLLLPALYLLVVFVPTLLGVVAIERQGMGRMFSLAHRDLGPTAGRVLLYLLIVVAYSWVLSSAIGAVTTEGSIVNSLLDAVLIQLPVGLVGLAVAVVGYARLRHIENPAIGTQALAAELQR
jgi:hypothetical protein